MSSSINRIDLDDLLSRYHRQQQSTTNHDGVVQQQEQHHGRDVVIDFDRNKINNKYNDDNDDDDDDDNMSTTSFLTSSVWDETIVDNHIDGQTSWQQWQAKGTFLTKYAMANQSWIYGITNNENENDDYNDKNTSTTIQIRWKTSLAPHRIHQIASNDDGTIIAATTNNGTVSILRGSDGKVLATRRLEGSCSTKKMSSSSFAPQVSFIKMDNNNKSSTTTTTTTTTDALLVYSPSSNQPALLVSNIQGKYLDHTDDKLVLQATQDMNLHTVQIPSISSSSTIHCMEGYYYYRIVKIMMTMMMIRDTTLQILYDLF